ncbi:hypothetical protein B1A87_003065 [Arthrobacter sp. KBS0703]|uniref:DUF5956 family protein n=1 Tax=Arthrobacter sp. KBS0703 TaxID=1955698 RepID=UPI00098EACB5|nr:DUF5956 family protein [Arthrobacter sp. KBS0703]TSE15046.1 hypothetical protein B1A87_003065 [Arthrobacter sp. KBS0703]
MWSDVQETAPSAAWAELPENGWGALMGWAAGEENLRRRRTSDAGRTVTGYIERAGEREPFVEPFSSADRDIIDDEIDAFLRDADLPPRPRGYVWMIRIPDGHASPGAFLADVDAVINRTANGTVDPKQLRPIFAQVFRDIYATGN